MLILAGAILGALSGYALALGLALVVLTLLGVSERQGERATLAGLILAPLGALAGAVAGGWTTARLWPGVAATGLVLALAVIILAALSAFLWLRSRGPLAPNRAPMRLHFELRQPAGAPALRITLITDRNAMPADLDPPRPEGADAVLSGAVDLYYRTRHRQLELQPGGEAPIRLRLPLPAAPRPGAWSDWQVVGGQRRLRWRVQD